MIRKVAFGPMTGNSPVLGNFSLRGCPGSGHGTLDHRKLRETARQCPPNFGTLLRPYLGRGTLQRADEITILFSALN
jgi:hypothetical protein